ncbi:phosphatidylinositol-glycan biosynthesis class f protein-related [Holotrichia oblita]|uniref:Phosphatidylinositol-glycan biosynthesis class f protein-related n=1 Tax=Holotrichia oblita TaxID=644536 RepID=A0ACB9TER2_HOLOL|nr:phosphatidylinositol-glycan biosynthesis class f protein-related [Holotrichia oblita]
MVLYSENSKVRLDGKTAIVTGCNTGIGKETVRDLYKRGCYVIMACRNTEKAEEAAKDIIDSCKDIENVGKLVVEELDLNSLKSVKKFCNKILEKHDTINLLINNAGIFACPYGRTEDGFETQFGTNHLAHFCLTLLLIPKIIKSAPSRIVTVTVNYQNINIVSLQYGGFEYNEFKVLKRRTLDNNRKISCCPFWLFCGQRYLKQSYPKIITCAYDKIVKCFFKTPVEGAQTTIYCAIDEKAGEESGLYYVTRKPTRPSSNAEDMEIAEKLWNVSLKLVGLEDYNFKQ